VPLLVDDIMNILVFLEAKCVGAERHPTNSFPSYCVMDRQLLELIISIPGGSGDVFDTMILGSLVIISQYRP
jgi:hypothetical protein